MKWILLAILFGYIGFCLYLYFFQEKIIFRPNLAPKEVALNPQVKVIFIDGIEVGIVDKKSETTLFYFGGNANNALLALNNLSKLPYNSITFNYPGYANSKGTPSQEAILQAAQKIFDRFKTKKNIIIGRSLGSAVASFIASNNSVDGVILITPFHSITHLAKLKYPYCPITYFLRHPLPTCQYIQKSDAKVFILLAQNDTTTPPATTNELIKCIKNLQEVYTIADAQHANILELEETWKKLEEFIEKLTKRD